MSEYWTLDEMMSKGKKKKGKDKDPESKKDKKKKKDKKEKKSKEVVAVSYSDFLRSNEKGLFIVKTKVEDTTLETYILKSDDFNFPRVALNRGYESYKDWLKRHINDMGSSMNVNKALYASTVKPIDIPKGLLSKIINRSKNPDE